MDVGARVVPNRTLYSTSYWISLETNTIHIDNKPKGMTQAKVI
jgi:hypothetical protein